MLEHVCYEPFLKKMQIWKISHVNVKGLCRLNVNIENQWETCLQIGIYVGLKISFLIQITPTIVSGMVTLRDKTFSLQVIQKLM